MKKVFLLEDDPQAMSIVEWVKVNTQFEVIHARTVDDAVYYFEYEDGLNYDIYLLDLSIAGGIIKLLNGNVITFLDEEGFNGLLLYKYYLKEQTKSSKIAFVTAFSNHIYNRSDLNHIKVIDKTSESFIKDLSKFLTE